MALPLIAGGIMAAGLAGSILDKGKKARVNLEPYRQQIGRGASEQRDLVNRQFEALKPLTEQYGQQRATLSGQIEPRFQQIGQDLMTGYGQVGDAEQQAIQAALARQQTIGARNLPLQQQSIREGLASAGQLRTGGAARAMQAPVSQFQQQQADMRSGMEAEGLARQAGRLERGTEAQANLAKEAFSTKLGMDKDTMDTLLSMNRTDLIEQAASLRGISKEETASMLSLLGIQTNVDLANQEAANAQRQRIWSSLTGVGGSLFGGIGGAIAGQAGSQATRPSSSHFPNQRLTY